MASGRLKANRGLDLDYLRRPSWVNAKVAHRQVRKVSFFHFVRTFFIHENQHVVNRKRLHKGISNLGISVTVVKCPEKAAENTRTHI